MIAAEDFTGVAQGDLIVFCLLSNKRSQSYKTSDSDDTGLAALIPCFLLVAPEQKMLFHVNDLIK